jgi:hypothetical protein
MGWGKRQARVGTAQARGRRDYSNDQVVARTAESGIKRCDERGGGDISSHGKQARPQGVLTPTLKHLKPRAPMPWRVNTLSSHAFLHARTRTNTHARTHAHAHAHAHTHVRARTHTYTHIQKPAIDASARTDAVAGEHVQGIINVLAAVLLHQLLGPAAHHGPDHADQQRGAGVDKACTGRRMGSMDVSAVLVSPRPDSALRWRFRRFCSP